MSDFEDEEEGKNSIISCLCWLPAGLANNKPKKFNWTEEEQNRIQNEIKEFTKARIDDDDDMNSDEETSTGCTKVENMTEGEENLEENLMKSLKIKNNNNDTQGEKEEEAESIIDEGNQLQIPTGNIPPENN